MGQLLRFPVIPAAIDRIVERDRAENITAERLQAVKTARAVLRSPEVFSDAILRDACAALQTWGDGTDCLTADAMIFAINKRERERAHEAARLAVETPASVMAQFRLRDVLAGAVAFVIYGWALIASVMWMGGW